MELSWKHVAVPRNNHFHDPGLEHALGRNWLGSLGVNLSKEKKNKRQTQTTKLMAIYPEIPKST